MRERTVKVFRQEKTYLYNVYGSSCLIATSEIYVRFNPNSIYETFHQRMIMKCGISVFVIKWKVVINRWVRIISQQMSPLDI